MELIDTHAHLYLEEFAADLENVVARARGAGVSRVYLPALDSVHHPLMFALEQKYPGYCLPMIGLHPCYVRQNYLQELEIIADLLTKRKFFAIGEIGLDYYWDTSFAKEQQEAFAQQLEMASRCDLPVAIHSRNSMDDTIAQLRAARTGGLRGIFHCFSGNLQNARDIIDCGLYLGIGGVVTYKNAGLDKVIADIPATQLVLETDAPYLTPVPFRGKRNESSYLRYVAAKVAAVKGMTLEDLAACTTANAKKIFGE